MNDSGFCALSQQCRTQSGTPFSSGYHFSALYAINSVVSDFPPFCRTLVIRFFFIVFQPSLASDWNHRSVWSNWLMMRTKLRMKHLSLMVGQAFSKINLLYCSHRIIWHLSSRLVLRLKLMLDRRIHSQITHRRLVLFSLFFHKQASVREASPFQTKTHQTLHTCYSHSVISSMGFFRCKP